MAANGLQVGGGLTQPPESIYREDVPLLQANFNKTRHITLLDDLPGGRAPPNMKKIRNTKGKPLEKALVFCGWPQKKNYKIFGFAAKGTPPL